MRTNQRLAQLWLDALATELGASAGTIDGSVANPEQGRERSRSS
jgi:hypothetical protein